MKYPDGTVIRWTDTPDGKMSRKAAKRAGYLPKNKKEKMRMRATTKDDAEKTT